MTTLYCECRAIESITDYGSYLSVQKEHKTGEIVAVYDTISETGTMDGRWLELGKQNQRSAEKHGNRGNTKDTKVQEARELFFWLPNEWCSDDPKKNQELTNSIATDFKDKFGLECMVALHWNRTKTNFHAHIMYSDRKMLNKPIEIIATRNEYYDKNWKRCKKSEAVHIIKKGDTKEIKYFENIKDERCNTRRFSFHETQLEPWIAELTGQRIFDRNSLKIAQQKIGNCKTKEAKERIKEENQRIRQYNQLVDELTKYDQCDIDDGLFELLDCIHEDLTNFKDNYLKTKKDAISHSNVLERTKTNKRVWKRKYDPNFNHNRHQRIKFDQIENMYDLLQWVLQLFEEEKNRARWQKLNFDRWQIQFSNDYRLAEIQIGNEIIPVSAKTMRQNSDGTYDVFLDLDQEIENEGQSMIVEDLLIKEKYIEKNKGWWER
nr:unnamed protein product [uncultured bacterium]